MVSSSEEALIVQFFKNFTINNNKTYYTILIYIIIINLLQISICLTIIKYIFLKALTRKLFRILKDDLFQSIKRGPFNIFFEFVSDGLTFLLWIPTPYLFLDFGG